MLIPSAFLYVIGFFNLLGIRRELVINHVIFLLISLAAFWIVRRIGVQYFRLNSLFFYWLFIILLIATYVIGLEAKGSQRWINLYFFNFQASEFLKIFFILFMANFISSNRKLWNEFSFFLMTLFYFALPTVLIFKQPDLGSAMVYAAIYFTMIFFSGIPRKYLLYLMIIVTLLLPLGWVVLKDYQRNRIVSFFNPHVDQHDTSYNMTQAIITVGSGKFTGRGLGLGTQSRLYFLPENHTDFAFSSLVEQFGFIGGLSVIALYIWMGILLFRKILKCYYLATVEARFKFLMYIGFFAFMVFQMFVNIGMNLGILPITGITLPLISYGGSSQLTWMMGIAMIGF